MLKPINQVLSSLVDQEVGNQFEHDNLSSDGTYPMEEFEVRIMEQEKSSGPWQTRATIPMQSSENALTVRVVTLFVSSTLHILMFHLTLKHCWFFHIVSATLLLHAPYGFQKWFENSLSNHCCPPVVLYILAEQHNTEK